MRQQTTKPLDIKETCAMLDRERARVDSFIRNIPPPVRQILPPVELPVVLDEHDVPLVRIVRVMVHCGKYRKRSPGYYNEASAALVKLYDGKPRERFAFILRRECDLSLRRAYELMALARGTKTFAELRAGPAQRMTKSRRR